MIGRANFTGRKRILHSDVHLVLDSTKSPLEVTVSLDLDLGLPSSVEVFLEAYRVSTVQRFALGSPAVAKEPLTLALDVGFPDSVLFRVKVVDPKAAVAVIVAAADRLRPEISTAAGQRRLSLLPVVPDDLGNEVWRVRYEDDHPELLVNKNIEGIMDRVASDAGFRSLVLPAAFREILVWILLDQDFSSDDDDQGRWPNRWLAFATNLVSETVPGQGHDVIRDWIDRAVSTFAGKLRLANGYAEAIEARIFS